MSLFTSFSFDRSDDDYTTHDSHDSDVDHFNPGTEIFSPLSDFFSNGDDDSDVRPFSLF